MIIMLLIFSILIAAALSQTLCSRQYLCEGSTSCCRDSSGNWFCCEYAAGICCPGVNFCCPASHVCQANPATCIFDPFGFLGSTYPSMLTTSAVKAKDSSCLRFYEECTTIMQKLINAYEIKRCYTEFTAAGLCMDQNFNPEQHFRYTAINRENAKIVLEEEVLAAVLLNGEACIVYGFNEFGWDTDRGELEYGAVKNIFRII